MKNTSQDGQKPSADVKEYKERIILAGYEAVDHLIDVAKEKIITGKEDDLSADKLKNAAATKKLAIVDAFDILKRIEEEKNLLEGKPREGEEEAKKRKPRRGFAEQIAGDK